MEMINEEEGDRAETSNGDQQQQDAYDKDFPPGYRFQPTDQELLKVYLFRKVNAFRLPPNRFVDVNFYSYNPWELAAAYQSYGENIHYFFTPREKKYPNGRRPNRAAGVGFWKACGADKPIHDEVITDQKMVVGYKRSLVFYRGKPSLKDKGENEKTNWIMHEYTLKKPDEGEENVEKKKGTTTSSGSYSTSTASSRKNRRNKKLCPPNLGNPKHKQLDEFVLCKLYLKLDKSTKEYPNDDPCDEDITQDNNIDAAPSPSMATTSAVVPTNYHPMYQYSSTSVVGAGAAVVEMEPVNRHHSQMMVIAPTTQEEMMPFSNDKYSDNINPSSSVDHYYPDEDLLEMLREWNNDIDQSQSNFLGSTGWINEIDSQSNLLGSACFSIPDIKVDIDPK